MKGENLKIHVHVDRYLPTEVPEAEAAAGRWLHERFQEKDK